MVVGAGVGCCSGRVVSDDRCSVPFSGSRDNMDVLGGDLGMPRKPLFQLHFTNLYSHGAAVDHQSHSHHHSVTSATMPRLRDKKLHRPPSSHESTINQSKTKRSEQLVFSRSCHSDVQLRSEYCHLICYCLTDVQVTLPFYVLQIMHSTKHSEHLSTFPQMLQ